jgi:hypothetical protein
MIFRDKETKAVSTFHRAVILSEVSAANAVEEPRRSYSILNETVALRAVVWQAKCR